LALAGWRVASAGWFAIDAAVETRWTSFDSHGDEWRAGARVDVLLGAIDGAGAAFMCGGGMAVAATRIASGAIWLVDIDPSARLGVRVSPDRNCAITLSLDSSSRVSLWLRTSIVAAFRLFEPSGGSIEIFGSLRYTDLFTLTACLDGWSIDFATVFPLDGGVR
jgi:hypothetical protein